MRSRSTAASRPAAWTSGWRRVSSTRRSTRRSGGSPRSAARSSGRSRSSTSATPATRRRSRCAPRRAVTASAPRSCAPRSRRCGTGVRCAWWCRSTRTTGACSASTRPPGCGSTSATTSSSSPSPDPDSGPPGPHPCHAPARLCTDPGPPAVPNRYKVGGSGARCGGEVSRCGGCCRCYGEFVATTKSRRGSKSRPSRSKPPAKKASGRPAAAKKPSRVREAARTQLGGHGTDALALGVLVLGLLSALALATDLTGPAGRALGDGLTALLGNGAFLVPLALVAVSVLLWWRRPEDEAPAAPLRVGIGVGLVLLAAAGLMHVLGGAPSISGSVDALRDAGGYFGAMVGAPLAAALGTVGATVVLVALLGFGLLLAPGTSMRTVLTAVGKGVARARTFVVAALDLGEHAPEDATAEDRDAPLTTRRPLPSRRATVESMADVDLVDEEDAEVEDEADDFEEEGYDEADEEPLTAQIAVADEPSDIAVREDAKGQMAIDLTVYGHGDWTLPPRDLLKRSTAKALDERVVEQGGEVLQATLRDFGVDAKLIGMTVGPTVTRYEL